MWLVTLALLLAGLSLLSTPSVLCLPFTLPPVRTAVSTLSPLTQSEVLSSLAALVPGATHLLLLSGLVSLPTRGLGPLLTLLRGLLALLRRLLSLLRMLLPLLWVVLVLLGPLVPLLGGLLPVSGLRPLTRRPFRSPKLLPLFL